MVQYGAIRFAVGRRDGVRSSTWRVRVSNDGSVFVSTRTLGGLLKVSLPSSGRWRIAFADSAAARIGAPAEDRALDKFTPGPEIVPGVRHGVMVVIPWLAVCLHPEGAPEEREVWWLPPVAESQVACVALFLTAPKVRVDGAIASATSPRGSGVSLKYATRAALPREVAEWTALTARTVGDERVEAATTTADVVFERFVVGHMPDGTRWLVDLRIPEANPAP